ncbi:NAD(P)H-hydrate dehydratase [Geomonas sp. RF6]|uniref:NAD(P)H-hydrate dehydratase n=1 Tax=Geomonas sp. RF6 TaxID=2897342 RepID=UPI001E4C3B4A|nr:NAD(P)H-hydrate dehydratase [Geomonas sp. RF6]UFS70890.1 NAD(P)H-hydrate dehydratase [Geomonas sp. RF6]
MKVVTGETMQGIDRKAIHEVGIPGSTLMEGAGSACADAIMQHYGRGSRKRVLIVAGKGNNGGDGYVVARLLRKGGWEAQVLVLATAEAITGDAAANLALLEGRDVIFAPEGAGSYRGLFDRATLLVDALLGTGVKSEVAGVYAEAIAMMNEAKVPVVSVDIPSGVDAATGRILGTAVRADLTVTFALPKLGNILHPGAELCGALHVADIGIPEELLEEAPGVELVDFDSAARLVRPRTPLAHKGSCGHVLIIAGSTGKTGAAAMAANAAVRTGSGLVTLAIPASLNPVLEAKTTEAMTVPVDDRGRGFLPAGALPTLLRFAEGRDAVAVGPGIGAARSTFYLVHTLVEALPLPLVLDADALNALALAPELLLKRRGAVTVLTPHPGEMARLIRGTIADVERDRLGVARDFAVRYGVHLVLKGSGSVVAAPDGSVSINGSGNAGMASGGMGDVLTGLLVSLLGQGYPPFQACQLGVFLHGYAADLIARERGMAGMKATEVQESLPAALGHLAQAGALKLSK